MKRMLLAYKIIVANSARKRTLIILLKKHFLREWNSSDTNGNDYPV